MHIKNDTYKLKIHSDNSMLATTNITILYRLLVFLRLIIKEGCNFEEFHIFNLCNNCYNCKELQKCFTSLVSILSKIQFIFFNSVT